MKRRGLLLPTAVALVAAAALVGGVGFRAPSVAPATGCPAESAVIPASALASAVPARACTLDGKVVTAGTLAVRVPSHDGQAVTAAGSARTGHPTMLTVERFSGAVRARIWEPDGAPEPRPRQPVSRLGRAHEPAAAPPPIAATESASVRCGDGAGAWLGTRWQGPYRWTMRVAGMPGYLGAFVPVRDAVRAAATSVDQGRNSCGLTGDLALSQRYSGETTRDAGIHADGTCGDRDERNVVAFGRLDGGLLALTCLWWSRSRTVEADVRISDATGMFTLNPDAGCTGSWDLQGTLTHELGHVFGLGHVSYAEHGELTMSDGLPACSSSFRALGLGDYQTLRGQYGTT